MDEFLFIHTEYETNCIDDGVNLNRRLKKYYEEEQTNADPLVHLPIVLRSMGRMGLSCSEVLDWKIKQGLDLNPYVKPCNHPVSFWTLPLPKSGKISPHFLRAATAVCVECPAQTDVLLSSCRYIQSHSTTTLNLEAIMEETILSFKGMLPADG